MSRILFRLTNTKSTWEKFKLRIIEEIVIKDKQKTMFKTYDG
jgi:hypothetical protein